MNKLIIVTGISGSGKTTISKYIYNHYKNSTIISMDILKENIYDDKKEIKNAFKDLEVLASYIIKSIF